MAARGRCAREHGRDPPGLEGARGAHAPRSQRRARERGDARHGRVQPGARALRVVARGRRGRGPSRCRPRRCARPSPSASCGRPRARPSRTARPSAPAITSRGSSPDATPAGSRCSSCGRAGTAEDGRVELEDGTTAAPADLVPVAYGCPVCGHCSGPAVERPALRPCPACLAELVQLERSERAVEPALRGIRSRARAGRATAAELGDNGLEELARERYRWAEGVGRRPREERRGQDARGLRACLCALGGRDRRRARAPASTRSSRPVSCRSSRGSRPRSRAPR